MLHVFPEYKKIWLALESIIFMFFAALIHDHRPIWSCILSAVLSSVFAFFMVELLAVRKHQEYLAILYQSGNAQTFLQIYLQRAGKPGIPANILFSMRMHLCNAYLALEDPDSATACLLDLPELPKKSYKKGEEMLAMQRARIAKQSLSESNSPVGRPLS